MRQFNFDSMAHIDRFKLTIKRIGAGKHGNLLFHDHDFSEIVVITESTETLHWCNGQSARIYPGDVLLLHPGIFHAYERYTDTNFHHFVFSSVE